MIRRLTLILLALLVAAPVALADRAPTSKESTAIRTAIRDFIDKKGSPAAKDNRVKKIRVSKVDDHWALVTVSSRTVGSAEALMKRRGSTWRVKEFGSGDFSCLPPKKVREDLDFGCVP